MKNSIFLLLIGVALPLTAVAQFRFAPERPQVAQTVSFTYTPAPNGLLDTTLEARYVRYGAPDMMHISLPATVTLVRKGNDYVGEVYMPKKEATGIMLYVRTRKQPTQLDLNGNHLFVIPAYEASGQLLPHATGGQASVFMRSHFLYETNYRPDLDWVVRLYDQELAQHPDLLPLYWSDRLAALIKQKKPGYGPTVKNAIEAYLASRPSPTAGEYNAAAQLYESMGDFPKAKALRERQKVADPTGALVQKDRAIAIRTETDWGKKKAAYQAFVRDFPTSPQVPGLAATLTDGYFKNNDIPGLVAFVGQQPASQVDVSVLNTIASQLAEERRSLPESEQLVVRAIQVFKAQPKPQHPSASWETDQQNRRRQLMTTYAQTLELQGKQAEAYAAYQEVMKPDDVENTDPRVNERYFLCALHTNHATDAQPMAEAAVAVGKATAGLKKALRDWYAQQPGHSPAQADAYLANLEADLKAEQRDELRQLLINEPAPAFSLTDLKGRAINSSALKGKVVVLDFWATWCGPCVASFPAMQQAQNRFQDDPNVRFLFVNTREGGPIQRVHDFMHKHPYNFVVPVDSQQKVANAYKVLGIPTKVVIGPNGRVRYRQIGYTGDSETMVNELALIVEMLKDERN